MYPQVEAVGCIRRWKRFSGETEKQRFFQYVKPYTLVEAVPYPQVEAAFDFGGKKLGKEKPSASLSVPQSGPGGGERWMISPLFLSGRRVIDGIIDVFETAPFCKRLIPNGFHK
jgi:hypothetical protein